MKWIERATWILLVIALACYGLYSHVYMEHYRTVAGASIVNDVGAKSLVLQLMVDGNLAEAESRLRGYLTIDGPMMQGLAEEYGYGRAGGGQHTNYLRVTQRLASLDLESSEQKELPIDGPD